MKLLGFDIGGTKCAAITADWENEALLITGRVECPTDHTVSGVDMVDRLFALAEGIVTARPDAIGISCGGPLDAARGVVLSPPNLPNFRNLPITEMAGARFSAPARLTNDANAGAVAEWKFGAGRGLSSMVFLTFGTGLGAGLILDGRLYEGISGNAGEVGHIRLAKSGPLGFGKHGSFEGFCSGGGLRQLGVAKARQMLDAGLTPSFCPDESALSSVTAQRVAECANAGHEDALAVYRQCGEMLGRGLAVLVDILNPERIVIGSIYARARHLLDEAMVRTLSEQALPQSLKACTIVPAALGESIGDVAALSVAVNGLQRRN
jgi:glucokinase